jgi:translocation and assembly module TamA
MWTWSYGAQLLATDERGVFSPAGVKDTRTFFIAALPLTLGYDGSDNLLDPTRGFRLSGWISPEYSGHGKSLTYARTQFDASAYHPVSDRVVVAGRIRLKQFGGNFGIVPFFDGGSLTTKAMPDLTHWRFAVGAGLRYYSLFGPIRIDVGVPLNRQKGDGPFAVTVSLGQAF